MKSALLTPDSETGNGTGITSDMAMLRWAWIVIPNFPRYFSARLKIGSAGNRDRLALVQTASAGAPGGREIRKCPKGFPIIVRNSVWRIQRHRWRIRPPPRIPPAQPYVPLIYRSLMYRDGRKHEPDIPRTMFPNSGSVSLNFSKSTFGWHLGRRPCTASE